MKPKSAANLSEAKQAYALLIAGRQSGYSGVDVSSKGHQETVGLAGSGLSYCTKRRRFGNHGGPVNAPRQPVTAAHVIYVIVIVLVILWILAHVLH